MSLVSPRHVSCPVLVLRLHLSEMAEEEVTEQVREELLACFNAVSPQHVILELQQVSYLNSNAFRPLLSLLREVRKVNGRLILCGLQHIVRDVLTVTHLLGDGSSAAPFEAEEDLKAGLALLGLVPPGP